MVDAEELAACFDEDVLRGYTPIRNFTREERRVIAASLRELRAVPAPRSEVQTEQADNDLGIVLSALHLLEEAVGETFDDEGGIVAQIEADYKVRQPALIEASRRPAQGSPEQPALRQYSREQLEIGVQYLDWDAKLDTETEIRQLGEAISRMGGPSFDIDLHRDITASRAEIKRLRGALEPFVKALKNAKDEGFKYRNLTTGSAAEQLCYQDFEKAALALSSASCPAQARQERHEATYLRGWNEGIECAVEALEKEGWYTPQDTIRKLVEASPVPSAQFCTHGVKVGNTCVGCVGAAHPSTPSRTPHG